VTGTLRVGPESAGATPGPACYGRGGVEPTVTDAHVVLGHLPPKLLGGAMELDVDAAHVAVQKIADDLSIDVHRAARGIIDIVNENMRGALRVVTVQKGLDPKNFSLVAFGGAGALHANALAANLGCFPVIVPPEPGVLSALGFVAADVRNEFSQTFIRATDRSAIEEARDALEDLGDIGRKWLKGEGISQEDQTVLYVVDMKYHRQGYEIPIEVAEEELGAISYEEIASRFKREHERLYGFSLPGFVELVNLRARAIGHVQAPILETKEAGGVDPTLAQIGTQKVWFDGAGREVPLYDRTLLESGMRLAGPAVVVQYDATTYILADHVATVDAWLNLVIEEIL
jgi:N-methylhydantoinase A